MSQMDDLIKKLLEEKTASMNSHISRYGDKMGINKVLNNPLFQKLRLATIASKAGLHQLGAEKVDSMFGAGSYGSALVDSSGAALGLSTPFKGKEIAKQLEMANVRKRLQSQAGYNNTSRDAFASTAASLANMKSLLNSSAMLAMVAGAGNSGLITTGGMASKLFGGMDAMGAATAHGLAGTAGALGAGKGVTAAIGGINPVMMGMIATIAATKASSMIYKTAIEGGSSLKLGKKALITSGTSTHQLEQDFGNTSALRMQIGRMQNTGMLKPSEALIANILAMIEGHTSVLPYIAANAIDSESRRNKESAGGAQNSLEDLFGDTGAIGSNDQLKKGKMGIISKLFTGMEKTTANLSATFDIMGQLSNTLSGQSSTKLYNEANSKDKTPEMLKAEKKFGETFGIPTGMVQAIHTTPAQIMNSSDTYEGKVLSILGLNSEINRFSAHELLKIRTTGFGIKNDTTNGFLAKLNEQYEEERVHQESNTWSANFKRKMDEIAGYIPGYQVLSGTYKMINSISDGINQFRKDDAEGNVRTAGQWWQDVLGKGRTNDVLNSEDELRKTVGATELGAQEQMANYLGNAYPDRFELLLSYNLSQMESLKAMAGNVDYSKNENLSMNKYTGKFQNNKAHQDYEKVIISKMFDQMELLQDGDGILQNMFGDDRSAISRQVEAGRKNNPFLDSFLRNADAQADANGGTSSIDPDGDQAEYEAYQKNLRDRMNTGTTNPNEYSQTNPLGEIKEGVGSADDMSDAQRDQEAEERKLSFAEQQVFLLQEIRDCCTGAEGRDFAAENDRRAWQEKRDKEKDDPAGGLIGSLLSGIGSTGAFGGLASKIAPILPRLGIWGLGIAGALAVGYAAWSMIPGNGGSDAEKSVAASDDRTTTWYGDQIDDPSINNEEFINYKKDLSKFTETDLRQKITREFGSNVPLKSGVGNTKEELLRQAAVSRNMQIMYPLNELFTNNNIGTEDTLKVDSLSKLKHSNSGGMAAMLRAGSFSDSVTPILKKALEIQEAIEDLDPDSKTFEKDRANLLIKKGKVLDGIQSKEGYSSNRVETDSDNLKTRLIPYVPKKSAFPTYGNNSPHSTASNDDRNGFRIKMSNGIGNSITKSEGSRSWRSNNPGNIQGGKGSWASEQPGYAGSYHASTGGTYAIFDTLQHGNDAQQALLFDEAKTIHNKKLNYPNWNISQVTNQYAPFGDGANNPVIYASRIASKLGKSYSPTKKMKDYTKAEQQIIMDAMQEHEGWTVGKVVDQNNIPLVKNTTTYNPDTTHTAINEPKELDARVNKTNYKYDTNNDGKFNESELKTLIAALEKLTDAQIKAQYHTSKEVITALGKKGAKEPISIMGLDKNLAKYLEINPVKL